jgi:beta-glucosidase
MEPGVVAADLVSKMTEDERLWCLDGDCPFWAGVAYLSTGGYHRSPFPAARVDRLGFPGFSFSDGPRGVVVDRATCFPVSMARGASWDTDLEERVGEAIGRELRAVGADLYGGVCVNLLRHPAWGRSQETYGEDPHHVGEMGVALTRGVQRHAMACVKHFACNSIENSRFKVDVSVDERALHEVYLRQFKRIVDEGVAAVMSAYNKVNGHYCGENRVLLTEILRDEWGFEGFVISDWIFGLRDAARSVSAGLDVEMPYRMLRAGHLREALESGTIGWPEVEAAAVRVVAGRIRFEEVLTATTEGPEVLACPEHIALAREVAAKSVVLMKNGEVDGARVLPLDGRAVWRVAVFGRLADIVNLGDGGSSDVWPPYSVTIREGLESVLGRAGREVVFDDGWIPERAAQVAAEADVAIVVCGYTDTDEGEYADPDEMATFGSLFPGADEPDVVAAFEERVAAIRDIEPPPHVAARPTTGGFTSGGDRRSLRLHDSEVALIRAVAASNPKTVVSIVSGGAVVISEWDGSVPAIVQSWYGGMEAGNGLADVLSGISEAYGRLPFSVPAEESELPDFDPDAISATYDRWHGWWRLERDGIRPPYPFGHGLSYTTFAVTGASVQTDEEGSIRVTTTVSNTGSRPGSEVVQVYSHRDGSDGPGRLVGFCRLWIEDGESQTAEIEVRRESLEERDVTAHKMVVVSGSYTLRVARDASDPGIALRLTIV